MWWDIAVTSTKGILCGGGSAIGGVTHPRVAIYRPDGTPVFAGTAAAAWSDAFTTVATDGFAGWYMAGTHHTAAAIQHVIVYRGSLLSQAGSWQCEWGGASDGNSPSAMAVYDTSCVVVGQWNGGASGMDQLVMMINY